MVRQALELLEVLVETPLEEASVFEADMDPSKPCRSLLCRLMSLHPHAYALYEICVQKSVAQAGLVMFPHASSILVPSRAQCPFVRDWPSLAYSSCSEKLQTQLQQRNSYKM